MAFRILYVSENQTYTVTSAPTVSGFYADICIISLGQNEFYCICLPIMPMILVELDRFVFLGSAMPLLLPLPLTVKNTGSHIVRTFM